MNETKQKITTKIRQNDHRSGNVKCRTSDNDPMVKLVNNANKTKTNGHRKRENEELCECHNES